MCSCNKGKNGSPAEFVVRTANGEVKTVKSEQEARMAVRIGGGSYSKK